MMTRNYLLLQIGLNKTSEKYTIMLSIFKQDAF